MFRAVFPMGACMKIQSVRTANRRRALSEASVSSVLLRIAALAGVGVVIVAPQAAAQGASCQATSGTETCVGAWSNGIKAPPVGFPVDTLIVRNIAGPIAPPAGTAGIEFHRSTGVTTNMNLSVDGTIDIIGNGTQTLKAFGIEVTDNLFGADPNQPGVTVTTAANVTLNGNFTAPNREAFAGRPGIISGAQANLATAEAAIPLSGIISTGISPPSDIFTFPPDFDKI